MPVDYISNRDKYLELLKKHLQGEKLEHSLGVERTAVALAHRYGADAAKAGLAGLLHDITKQKDNITLAKKYGIIALTEKTLHGPVAACWLKERGVVEDGEVLLAVKYHTTGRADMSLLEKIIYIADYIEPARDFEGVEELRREASKNLDRAVLLGLQVTLGHLLEKNGLIDADSVAAYNCYRHYADMQML